MLCLEKNGDACGCEGGGRTMKRRRKMVCLVEMVMILV